MSFLVLVLGALLSLGGVVSIYSGYGIVEVERGWTSVIAGTTALSAGVITIGIAFILRCLTRLQAFLEAEKGLLPLLSEIALHRAAYYPRPTTSLTTGFEASPATGVSPAVLVGVTPDVSRTAAKDAAKDLEAESQSSWAPEQDVDPTRAATLDISEDTPRTEGGLGVSHRPDDRTRMVEATNVVECPQSDTAGTPAQAWEFTLPDDDAHEASKPRGALPPAIGIATVETFGRDSVGLEPEAPAHAPDLGTEAAPNAVAVDAIGATCPESEASGRTEGPGQDHPGQRMVTGRYEADGTSYVMYSDGSIDALSANGAVQFQSMAELKAFMETRG